ncbi:MAG: class I SAM-dependent methyltransferase [Thermoleophilia bacterium]|nr:class I SAM-dependent methyltransferase [Thermoleophilia bacterium]MDH4339092.1 class I SAM-dependent methyltransferase [Thermoleophilia bacterium]MDH5280845.1 class I SAM-dependent methyltransferase [Thermoleophilia bacterium]
MTSCCRAGSCEQFFKPSVARRSLETYRRKGLDALERQMVASASATGTIDGLRVLEIGGGIGRIQAELLDAGAGEGEIIELVSSYEPYARELAREKGHEARTAFHIVDILEEPDRVEPADVVVLNRVVCCSPDGVALAAAAGRLARQALVLSFPRDVFWIRAGVRMLNASLWIMRSPFRVFVHRPAELFAAAEAEGVHVREGDGSRLWQWATLRRAV